MKKVIALAASVLVVALLATHWYMSDRGRWTTEPEYSGLSRTVSANELESDQDPAVILRFDSRYRYVGGQKFVLYGVADTEQHFFVETTADDELRSAYWVQYEAYLPDRPSYRYDYEDSPLRISLDGYTFYADTAVVESSPKKRRRGTDGAMAREFLASKGYAFPQDFAYARLVYLTDESRRKELMIIFVEDLAAQGLTAAELKEGGAKASLWPEVEQAHLETIDNTLTVVPNSQGSSEPETAMEQRVAEGSARSSQP